MLLLRSKRKDRDVNSKTIQRIILKLRPFVLRSGRRQVYSEVLHPSSCFVCLEGEAMLNKKLPARQTKTMSISPVIIFFVLSNVFVFHLRTWWIQSSSINPVLKLNVGNSFEVFHIVCYKHQAVLNGGGTN